MIIWSIIYITAVLIAQYTATWFFPLPLFGLVAFGTVAFGITFTARDYVHGLGRRYVYMMILAAALASVALSVVGEVHWRIIAASITAILLAETADTEIYHRLLQQRWLVRVAGSNSISIPLDSVLFNGIAFAGIFAVPVLAAIIFGEIVVKFVSGGLVALWRLI